MVGDKLQLILKKLGFNLCMEGMHGYYQLKHMGYV